MIGTPASRKSRGSPVYAATVVPLELVMGLLVALLVGVTLGAASRSDPTSAQTESYRWWLRQAPDAAQLIVLPTVDGGWDRYIEANRDRLDRWLLEPDLAPDLSGTQVSITFSRPVTPSVIANAVGLLRGIPMQHTSVGRDERGRWIEETTVGGPSHDAIGSVRVDAGAGYEYTLHGVVSCLVLVGTDGPIDVATLEGVRRLSDVYLLDTTAVQVTRVDIPARESTEVQVGTVVMDAPWHLLAK